MAFLLSTPPADALPDLRGPSLILRLPASGDYPAWAELRSRSRHFLMPYEPTWTNDELTRAAYKRRLKQYYKDLREGSGYALFAIRREDRALVGGLSLSNVRRGVAQTATLGYWMGAPYAGHGYMTEAVSLALPLIFEHLWLNRVEAACLTHNVASMRVLEKNGFSPEGVARRYLKINGSWQDHRLYGLVAEDYRVSGRPSGY